MWHTYGYEGRQHEVNCLREDDHQKDSQSAGSDYQKHIGNFS
jgi:hypothetical protein